MRKTCDLVIMRCRIVCVVLVVRVVMQQRLNQSVVSVDVCVQPLNYAVVRVSVLAEIVVLGRHLLQGVGQIERHLFLLRIKHQRDLVRLSDDVQHPLSLQLIILVEPFLRLLTLLVCRLQLNPKVLKRIRQRPFAHDSP